MSNDGSLLWLPGTILLGFQLTLFSVRIRREQEMEKEGKPAWLPLAEWLNLGSMLLTVAGVLVPSLLGLAGSKFIRFNLAASVALLGGYPIALAAHYGLLSPVPATPAVEKRAVQITVGVAALFIVLGILKLVWSSSSGE